MSIPVSIKIRSGPDEQHETAVEVSRLAEAAGAAAVSVHARSVAQGYVGEAELGASSARVKQAVRIPVLGGGGIRTAADAVRLLRETGADAVAIGRGCLGNPWIFEQARSLWTGGAKSPRADGPAAGSRDAATCRGRVSLLRPDGGVASLAADELLLCEVPAELRRVSRGRARSAESGRFPAIGERVRRLKCTRRGGHSRLPRCVDECTLRRFGFAGCRPLIHRRADQLLDLLLVERLGLFELAWPACRACRGAL